MRFSCARVQNLNALVGSIPSCLVANLRVLTLLDVSRNYLTGTRMSLGTRHA